MYSALYKPTQDSMCASTEQLTPPELLSIFEDWNGTTKSHYKQIWSQSEHPVVHIQWLLARDTEGAELFLASKEGQRVVLLNTST